MVDAEVRVGLYERLIEHLLLLVGHIRYEQAEEGHELLYLARKQRVHLRIIYAVEQLHLRRERVAYLHDVDAVRRSGRYADELPAYPVARAPELVTLDGRYDEALYAAHPHAQGKQLHGESLARARGAEQYEIRVLVHLSVEQVYDAQRVVVAVHAQQHAGVVGHLKARE